MVGVDCNGVPLGGMWSKSLEHNPNSYDDVVADTAAATTTPDACGSEWYEEIHSKLD
jgi:hypothetical protein